MGTANSNSAVDVSLMDQVFEKYREQQGALIPILQKAQGIYGYLPPEILQVVARWLGVALGKV
ncbi:MAG TPA: NAD(P)H-dependent oxidoreductase subunit E, partial [Anaerolineae bacterium]|nr:NAD(P)H-dependent oxidoreductase subunit E [Anaerolineae bacterium]